jgi:hypothetical protein
MARLRFVARSPALTLKLDSTLQLDCRQADADVMANALLGRR